MIFFKHLFLLSFFLFTITAHQLQAQHHEHKDHLDQLVKQYLAVKEALTEDDFTAAREHLNEFKEEVTGSEEMKEHSKHPEQHAEHHGSMVEALTSAEHASGIEELRESFIDISKHLSTALENQGYKNDELFLQYCPMAADGDGAYWISDDKEIRNPYYGSQMPDCGETHEHISGR